MIHIHRLTMLSYGTISCYSPCWFPFSIFPCQFLPFLKSLLLTWNPSFCVVRSCPPWSQVARKLTSLSPFPPHSDFPTPWGFPKSIVRLTKTTSRSRLCIVRNRENDRFCVKLYFCENVLRNETFLSHRSKPTNFPKYFIFSRIILRMSLSFRY